MKSILLTISLLPLGAYAFGPSGPPNNPSTAMDNSNGAVPDHVISGRTYWGLVNGNWGKQTGTLPVHGSKTYIPQAAD
jgi:hypothetical protein